MICDESKELRLSSHASKEGMERLDEARGREDEGAGSYISEGLREVRSPPEWEERAADQEPLLPRSGEEDERRTGWRCANWGRVTPKHQKHIGGAL